MNGPNCLCIKLCVGVVELLHSITKNRSSSTNQLELDSQSHTCELTVKFPKREIPGCSRNGTKISTRSLYTLRYNVRLANLTLSCFLNIPGCLDFGRVWVEQGEGKLIP